MTKGGGSAPGDPTAETEAVLAAARRSVDGTGKAGKRRLARLDRLEKKIERALKEESKRRRQLDEARSGLADLVARVAALVPSGGAEAAPQTPSPEAPSPAPARARATRARAATTRARPT
jgi:hypothetical protein